jgi:hypothetical protein
MLVPVLMGSWVELKRVGNPHSHRAEEIPLESRLLNEAWGFGSKYLQFLLLSLPTLARPPVVSAADTYELSWWSIDGGGTMNSSAGEYSVSGTIGQPDAGIFSGGGYTLTGGFWGVNPFGMIYLPLIIRN